MTLIIPEGFAECAYVMKHDLDPVPWLVTFGISMEGVGASDPENTADNLAGAYDAHLSPGIDDNITMQAVRMTIGAAGSGDHVIFEKGYSIPGGAGPQRLPQNCALLVKKQTALGGRKGKGRFYWPGMLTSAGVNEVGQLDGGLVDALQTAFEAWFAAVGTGAEASPLMLLHNDTGAGTPVPTVVTRLQVDSLLSTQRRRLR